MFQARAHRQEGKNCIIQSDVDSSLMRYNAI